MPTKPRTPDQKARDADQARARRAARKATAVEPPAAVTVPDLTDLPELDLVREAKAEHAAMKAWRAAGEDGTPPAQPHLDHLNVRKAAGVRPTAKKRTTSPTAKSELYLRAMEAKKAGKRGKGIKATDEELVIAARDLSGRGMIERQAMEVAYWVNSLAVSRGRWAKAWATATQVAQVG